MLNTTSFVVVGDKGSVSVTNVIGSNKYNVVDYRWVLQCIERKAFEFPSMQHVSEGDVVGDAGVEDFPFRSMAYCADVRRVCCCRWTDGLPPFLIGSAGNQWLFVFTGRLTTWHSHIETAIAYRP